MVFNCSALARYPRKIKIVKIFLKKKILFTTEGKVDLETLHKTWLRNEIKRIRIMLTT